MVRDLLVGDLNRDILATYCGYSNADKLLREKADRVVLTAKEVAKLQELLDEFNAYVYYKAQKAPPYMFAVGPYKRVLLNDIQYDIQEQVEYDDEGEVIAYVYIISNSNGYYKRLWLDAYEVHNELYIDFLSEIADGIELDRILKVGVFAGYYDLLVEDYGPLFAGLELHETAGKIQRIISKAIDRILYLAGISDYNPLEVIEEMRWENIGGEQLERYLLE